MTLLRFHMRILLVILLFVQYPIEFSASDYTELRDAGIRFLNEGKFADAKFKFDGAEGLASETELTEITKLQNILRDSVNIVYNAAYELMGVNNEKAIMKLERLFDRTGKPMHMNLFAQLGWCYGRIKMKEKQRILYETGLEEGEQLSAYYLARLIQYNKESISTDSLLNLYKIAVNVASSVDSVGIIYYRKKEYNISYSWFDKNKTVFSKYWRAIMLLDVKQRCFLEEKYKTDDPIQFLTEASSANNLTLAKKENCDALFYLGRLYYYAEPGDILERNRDKGIFLIKRARDLGHPEAKRLWYKWYNF